MEEGGENPLESYAGVLKSRIAHAPHSPSKSEVVANVDLLRRQERVEPELVAAASNLGRYAEFHPTKARLGEELPDNLYRSSAGFLINKQAVAVKLDKSKVLKEIDFFQKHVVISYFVGGALSFTALQGWAIGLQKDIEDECRIGRAIGNGFFQIVTKSEATTQKILMMSPHLSRWGTSIMQPWVPDFNPNRPVGLKLPVWITLKGVTDELLSSAQDLASGIGVVLGRHRGNATSSDQRFCVAVQSGRPFDLEISTENPITGGVVIIQVDYNNLPIRCRLCLSTSHLIKDCGNPLGQRRPATYQNDQEQANGPRPYLGTRSNHKEQGGGLRPPTGAHAAEQEEQGHGRKQSNGWRNSHGPQHRGAGESSRANQPLARTVAAGEPSRVDQRTARETGRGDDAAPPPPTGIHDCQQHNRLQHKNHATPAPKKPSGETPSLIENLKANQHDLELQDMEGTMKKTYCKKRKNSTPYRRITGGNGPCWTA